VLRAIRPGIAAILENKPLTGVKLSQKVGLLHNEPVSGWDLVVVSATVLAFAIVSRRVDRSIITPAILFVAVGLLLGDKGFGVFDSSAAEADVRLFAEVTLALVLFADASALDTKTLRRETRVPSRLLGIGLPLSILIGTIVAIPFFPTLGLFEAAALAVLLAPTDAALGQAVVSDSRLPSRVRQGLSVESGLNDGLCVPLLFAAIATAELAEAPSYDGEVVIDLVKEVGIASLVGVSVAVTVVLLFKMSMRRDWMDDHWAQVVPLAAAALSYVATDELGGSGFIATFVAGLVYGHLLGSQAHHTILLSEEIGGVLSAVTFFLFGAFFVGPALADLDIQTAIYAVLSLTIVRMLPVAIGFIGSGAAPPTMAFAGWFGPRGLASIVFMLTIAEESNLLGTEIIVQVVTVTVALSVVAHGLTANVLINRYIRWFDQSKEALVLETQKVDMPGLDRGRWHRRGGGRSALPDDVVASD